ncbi:MAG: hypothetical protein A3F92_08260 [Candidatus Rokubacteria bacterium RIFCSPLOWO2_12_FULL_71_22]|nr:MAG: hypothetical protein A3F92_08260 [Candidatus Rokubacteria bacterium RIFCSPLOWO2_12_FULL_71_22]
MSWSPIGSPAALKPQRRDTAGNPARLDGTVKTSLRYIASGSSFSPSLKATPGAVGATRTSTRARAVSRSRRTSVRTFCARP